MSIKVDLEHKIMKFYHNEGDDDPHSIEIDWKQSRALSESMR